MDLLAAHQRFGLWGVNYCMTTYLLYRYKHQFFSDSISTIPLMTAFFGIVSTCIQAFLLIVFEGGIHIDLAGAVTDFVFMPFFDGIYAYLFFILPGIFMPKATKREYFFNSSKGKRNG